MTDPWLEKTDTDGTERVAAVQAVTLLANATAEDARDITERITTVTNRAIEQLPFRRLRFTVALALALALATAMLVATRKRSSRRS
jgi:hypothetical protein